MLDFPASVSYQTPTKDGDADRERVQLDLVRAARDAQRVEFALAPRCALSVAGHAFQVGDEVTSSHLAFHHLLRLVDLGVLLRIDRETAERRSRAMVPGGHHVGRRAITTPRGILSPGEPVSAEDLATAAKPSRTYTDKGGAVITTKAVPASDGTAELERAVRAGLIVQNPSETTTAPRRRAS